MIDAELQPHLSQLLRDVREQEQRQRLVTYLRRYVSPVVSLRLLRQGQLAKLIAQGEMKPVTVFFVDIRGYVSAIEQIEKSSGSLDLAKKMLLDFSDTVTQVIFKYEGIGGEFAGDRIMALFGVPDPHPDDAARALRAAIELHTAFAELHDQWQREQCGLPRVRIGIGINTGGPVLIGDIGSRWRRELSVIGMAANIAARLEELTKEDNGQGNDGLNIIVSEATYRETGDVAVFSPSRQQRLRGVSEPVTFRRVHGLLPVPAPPEELQDEEQRQQARQEVEEIAEWIESAHQREESVRISEALSAIAEASSIYGAEGVLDEVMIQGRRMLDARRLSLSLLREEAGQRLLEFVKVMDNTPSESILGMKMPWDQGWVGKVVTTGEPLILFDMLREDQRGTHFDQFDERTKLRPRSMLCVPLKVKGQVIGAIQVNDEEPYRYSTKDLNILIFVAAQAAVAIERAESSKELYQMGNAIVSSLDRDVILNTVMESTQRLLRADRASILLLEGQALAYASVSPPEWAEKLLHKRLSLEDGYIGDVFRSGMPFFCEDLRQENHRGLNAHRLDLSLGMDVRSVLCVPLVSKGNTIGIIEVADKQPLKFTREDLNTLVFIAAQAAVAIENAAHLIQLRRQLIELEQSRRRRVAVETRARLGDIAGKLVHELNNRLGAVRVFAQDILDDPEVSEESRDSALDILESVESSLKEVKDLRLVLKQPEEQPGEFDLTALIRGAIHEFELERAADDANLALASALDQGPFRVFGNEQEIKYVLNNLLDNAADAIQDRRKACPELQGLISIRSQRAEGGDFVEVWVSDNGVGVAPEHVDRLFDAEFTTKPEGKGMGYGLSWAQLYVQGLGGEIVLHSSVQNQGTTLVVRLPLMQ